MSRRSDLRTVDSHQRVTSLYCVALGNETREAVAIHVNGVDADVHKDLYAIGSVNAHGMRHEHAHGAGNRRIDDVAVGVDGAALAHHLSAEHGIGHVMHLYCTARNRRTQHVDGGVCLDACRLCRSGRSGLLFKEVKESHCSSPSRHVDLKGARRLLMTVSLPPKLVRGL